MCNPSDDHSGKPTLITPARTVYFKALCVQRGLLCRALAHPLCEAVCEPVCLPAEFHPEWIRGIGLGMSCNWAPHCVILNDGVMG
jgi:hypothetical protein